jgi:hypothetical protein
MSRYILIDNNSGCIFGDSADLNGKHYVGTPEEYAAALDRSVGEVGRTYTLINHNPRSKGAITCIAQTWETARPCLSYTTFRIAIRSTPSDVTASTSVSFASGGGALSMADWRPPLIDATADSPDRVLGKHTAMSPRLLSNEYKDCHEQGREPKANQNY